MMNSLIFPDARLVVFAKAPVPGKVKTRLLPAISAAQAATLQSRLMSETLAMTHRQRLCRVQLWCSPSAEHPDFRNLLNRYPISLHTQSGTDLGDRMGRAIAANLNRYAAVVLIGCDCPSLCSQDLINAFFALRHGSDVVLGPAEDGGYVLIGMKQSIPDLFHSIPWGTAEVLSETKTRIRRLGLQYHETRCHWDLDRPEDLQRYRLFKRIGGLHLNSVNV